MFKRSDKRFDDVLESPELLENYLAELEKRRRLHAGVFIFASLLFLLKVATSFWAGSEFSAGSLLSSTIMLFLSVSQFAAFLSAQASFRTLKAHKKTLELIGARSSTP